MSGLKTHAEIIDEMRFHGQQNINAGKAKREYGILTYEGRLHKNFADDLAAAHKRELDELRKQVGNAAKSREALSAALDMIFDLQVCNRSPIANSVYAVRRKIKDALAAPPRNCDLLFKVEGTTWNIADKAWRVFKRTHPDAYFDTPNLVRCIEWLFATADESEVSK